MDNSDTYILMCEKSGLQHPTSCDRDSVKHVVSGIVIDSGGRYWSVKSISIGWVAIPLFSQDQLQAMISNDWNKVLAFLYAFAKNYDMTQCKSMQQMCLALVMAQKFGKVWNGTDWELCDEAVKVLREGIEDVLTGKEG